jgi:histidinol phosphatase-like enzyme
MKHKSVFIDRAGTVNVDFGYVYKPDEYGGAN